jgi:hypothetical protein
LPHRAGNSYNLRAMNLGSCRTFKTCAASGATSFFWTYLQLGRPTPVSAALTGRRQGSIPRRAFITLLCGCGGIVELHGRQGTDVTGTWDVTVESESSAGDAVIVLKQEGQNLTGRYKGRMGESSLSGSVRGNSIRFSVNLRFRDMSFTVSYSGSVESDSMRGTVDFGDGKTGTWAARRRA